MRKTTPPNTMHLVVADVRNGCLPGRPLVAELDERLLWLDSRFE